MIYLLSRKNGVTLKIAILFVILKFMVTIYFFEDGSNMEGVGIIIYVKDFRLLN